MSFFKSIINYIAKEDISSNDRSKSKTGSRYDSRGNLKVELQELLITLGNNIISNDIDSIRLSLIDLVKSTREKSSGDSYISNLEIEAVNYTERSVSLIAAVKYLATVSDAKDRYNPNQLITKVIGVAHRKCSSHLLYLTSGCQGCADHKYHNRYAELKKIRNSGNINLYVDELEAWLTLYYVNSLILTSIIETLYTNSTFNNLPNHLTESDIDRQARKAMKIIGERALDIIIPALSSKDQGFSDRKYNRLFHKSAVTVLNNTIHSSLEPEAKEELLRLQMAYPDISNLVDSVIIENDVLTLVDKFAKTILSNFDSSSELIEESDVNDILESLEYSVIKSSNIYREAIPILVSALAGSDECVHPFFRSALTNNIGLPSSSAMENITFKYNSAFNLKYHEFLRSNKDVLKEDLELFSSAYSFLVQDPIGYRKQLASIYSDTNIYHKPDQRSVRYERFYLLWDIKHNKSLEDYLEALFSAELSQFKIEYICWKLNDKIHENKAIHNTYSRSYVDPYQMIIDMENLIYLSCIAFQDMQMRQKSTITE